jgi:hypothetical protein
MQSEQQVHAKKVPRRVIVLNWKTDLQSISDAFADFSPPGSEIVFVHEKLFNIAPRVRSVRFKEVRTRRLWRTLQFVTC